MRTLKNYGNIIRRIYSKRLYQIIVFSTVIIASVGTVSLFYISESLKKQLHRETIKKIKIISNSMKSEVEINIMLNDTSGLKLISKKAIKLDNNIEDITFFNKKFKRITGKKNTELTPNKKWNFKINENLLLGLYSNTFMEKEQFFIHISYNIENNINFIHNLRVKTSIFVLALIILLNSILFKMFYDLEKEIIEKEKNRSTAELASAKEQNQRLFLANMSHEIRTPLSGIMGLLSLMQKTNLNKKQKKYLSAIDTSSKTLLTVINDILDLAKIEEGEITLIKKDFNIKNTIDQIYDLFSGKCIDKNLMFTNDFLTKMPTSVLGDQARLNQVIYNLVSNAIKFTSIGFVKMTTDFKYKDNSIGEFQITIEDSGIGIPSNKIKEIFSPFKQIEDYEKRKFEGTGLGLSIAQKMITLMNGKISVKSTEGQGASFTLSIPLKYSNEEKVSEHINTEKTSLKNIKILMAEDNPINQLMATEMLSQEAATVTVVENGLEAVKILENEKFDIILMDMQMPIMSGYEAMKRIRENKNTTNNKIIALTAHVNENELKKCMESGADDYVSKPFEIEHLKKQILKLVVK